MKSFSSRKKCYYALKVSWGFVIYDIHNSSIHDSDSSLIWQSFTIAALQSMLLVTVFRKDKNIEQQILILIVFFILNLFCLLIPHNPPSILQNLKCTRSTASLHRLCQQTWASPVFWVDQLWTRSLLTAYWSGAVVHYWSCVTSPSAGLPSANLECKLNKLRYVCSAQCTQIHSHWEGEFYGI